MKLQIRKLSSERETRIKNESWKEREYQEKGKGDEIVRCSFHSHESVPTVKSTSMWQYLELWVIWVAICHSVYVDLRGFSQLRSRDVKMANFSLIFVFTVSLNFSWLFLCYWLRVKMRLAAEKDESKSGDIIKSKGCQRILSLSFDCVYKLALLFYSVNGSPGIWAENIKLCRPWEMTSNYHYESFLFISMCGFVTIEIWFKYNFLCCPFQLSCQLLISL